VATSATWPAPTGGGGANAVRMERAAPARQARQRSGAKDCYIGILVPLTFSSRQLPLQFLDRQRPTQHLLLLTAASETKLHGERQGRGGGMLAQAGLPSKAAGTNLISASSFPARPPASNSLLSLLEGGGGGRRLAPAGRRQATRCVMVHE
jgi:hypothetical protein